MTSSRQVGVSLKHLPSPSTDPSKKSPTWHSGNVPWQRVINNKGGISPRVSLSSFVQIKLLLPVSLTKTKGPTGASRQAAALRVEGVDVTQGAMGEFTVDLQRFGWFPSILPSEASQVESTDEEGEDAAAYHT
jgi:methylated-DNA-protein-cysteine methyltransferase-like protein